MTPSHCSSTANSKPPPRGGQVDIEDGTFYVDTSILGELLALSPAEVPELMRSGAITSVCERGIDTHAGEFRLSFFHKSRRVRLSVDDAGHILRRSVVDFGDQPLPRAMRRS